MLTVLAMQPGEPVPSDRLAEAVWGDTRPGKWEVTLRGLIRRLRDALGDRDLISTSSGGYVLNISPGNVDALSFRGLLAEGKAHMQGSEWKLAQDTLEEAEALWRGIPFSDVPSDWLHHEHEVYLEEDFAQVRTMRLEAAVRLSLRTAANSVPDLRRLVAAHPERESPRRLLILALYRAGRHREALEEYRQWWDHMREETGADPLPSIRAVGDRITRQDEALLAEPLRYDTIP